MPAERTTGTCSGASTPSSFRSFSCSVDSSIDAAHYWNYVAVGSPHRSLGSDGVKTPFVDGLPSSGCRCDGYENAAICLGREALICQELPSDPPSWGWFAVEDGPCEPRADETCAMGELVATAEDCLAEHSLCQVMTNGEFCGSTP